MAKRKIKQEDSRSPVRVGCATLTLTNNTYVWTCGKTNRVIIKQDALRLSATKYEEKAAKRLKQLRDALETHQHAEHR